MKLITKKLEKEFEKRKKDGSEEARDMDIVCKLFNPSGPGTWYCYDYDPEDRILHAFAVLNDPRDAECGTVSLDELESHKGMFGLGIERDKFFDPGDCTLQEIIDKYGE